MTGNEKDLLAMKEAGMIDGAAFDLMWKELHAEGSPITEVFTQDEAGSPPTEDMPSIHGMKISAGAYSVKGVREQNEDSFFLGTETGGAKDTDSAVFNAEGNGPFFFAAADGMGGHDAGDVASAFVVMKLKQSASFQTTQADDTVIEAILKGIHAELLAEAKKGERPIWARQSPVLFCKKGTPVFLTPATAGCTGSATDTYSKFPKTTPFRA